MVNIWKCEERKFLKMEKEIKIPDEILNDVDYIEFKNESDFNEIQRSGGCYWIWTNEPVIHKFHKHKLPVKFNDGEIIYNGIAKDDIKGRIKHHLLGEPDAGWSGISLDIYFGKHQWNRKKAYSNNSRAKVPYIDNDCKPIRNKNLLLKLFLSEDENKFINNTTEDDVCDFRNGINIFEEKHKNFIFRVYFINNLESLYLEFIEKKWRKMYGLPKLCSYLSGR